MQQARTLAAVCGPLLSSLILSACSLEPGFNATNSERSFGCAGDPQGSMKVTFDGGEATLVDQGKQITLRFASSIWPRLEDRYESEGYVLTFDPEAFLKRPDGSTRGPCL